MKQKIFGILAAIALFAGIPFTSAYAQYFTSSTPPNGSVTVLSPNGGETYYFGGWMPYIVRPNSAKTGTLTISLVQNPSVTNPGVIHQLATLQGYNSSGFPQGYSASVGLNTSYPPYVAGAYYLKAEWLSNDGMEHSFDFSDAQFKISLSTTTDANGCSPSSAPWAKIISPNGGESFTVGQSFLVKWATCNISASANVALNLINPSDISTGYGLNNAQGQYLFANDGQEYVTMPNPTMTAGWSYGKHYEVRILANTAPNQSANDDSDATFWVRAAQATPGPTSTPSLNECIPGTPPWVKVLSPNGGESYAPGESVTVRWTSCNVPLNAGFSVDINYEPLQWLWNLLGSQPSLTVNDGSETVTLPTSNYWPGNPNPIFLWGSNYKFRLGSNIPGLQDYSDNTFRIGTTTSTSSSTINQGTSISGSTSSSTVISSATCPIGALFSPLTGKPCTTISTPTSATIASGAILLSDLSLGSRGDEVRNLQQKLVNAGLLSADNATGYFGMMTEAAVKRFQASKGLPVVGRVGPMTRNVLNGY